MTVAAGSDALAQDIIKSTAISATSTGSANAYVITLATAPDAYATGMLIVFKANFSVTGAATVNVNSLGAKTIKKDLSTDLEADDIKSGETVAIVYDGTNFQLVGKSRRRVELRVPLYVHARSTTTSSSYGEAGASTDVTDYLFDPALWDPGATFYFETIADDTSGANRCRVELQNSTDSLQIAENSHGNSGGSRVRSAALTMPSASKTLKVRIKNTDGSTTVGITAAFLIVKVPL
jgi:hypothetical protein